MQNLKHVGATVIELRFFNRIKKKKKNMDNYFYEYLTHITSNYIKFLIGVNFHGDLHFDVSRCCITLKLKVKIGISLSMVE